MTKEERKIITRKLESAYAMYIDFYHMCGKTTSVNTLGVTQNDVHAAQYEYNGIKSIACALGFDMDKIRTMEDRIREEKWNYYMGGI